MIREPVVPLFAVQKSNDLFRVAIVCFYDRFNFCTEGIKQSIVHFAPPDGRLIPLDAYYLFYDSYTYVRPGSLQLPLITVVNS